MGTEINIIDCKHRIEKPQKPQNKKLVVWKK